MTIGGFENESEGYDFMMKRASGGSHGFSCFGMEAGGHSVNSVVLDYARTNFFYDHAAEERQQVQCQSVAMPLDVERIALAYGDGLVFL